MVDTISTLDTSQPLPEDTPQKHSGVLGFLDRFGKKENDSIPQQTSSPIPQPPASETPPSTFLDNLNKIDSSQPSVNPPDTAPSMDGADVVKEPTSSMASDPTQPQIPQEPQGSANLGSSLGESAIGEAQRPATDISPPPAIAEPSITPDPSGAGDESNIPDAKPAEPQTESAPTLPEDAREQLVSVEAKLQEAIEQIGQVLGGTPAAPKEPVMTAS